MITKIVALMLLTLSCEVLADSWCPDLIKFNLENGEKTETMLWISGYSYSSTAFYQRANCIKKPELIESKLLIEALNYVYQGKTITSEQASNYLDMFLSERFGCNPYNNQRSTDSGTIASPPAH